MPVSTDKKSGFLLSNWELKYLKCRYRAHRNKIAAAKPAIDSNPPKTRSHVEFKMKKALKDKQRQMEIFKENIRVLNHTAEIMGSKISMYGTGQSNTPSQKSETLIVKKNYRIIFQWFLRKFGHYVPWWSQIRY